MNVSSQILRYLTDRPGSVVYKDEIMEALNLNSTQVSNAVRRFQLRSPIGVEIVTITSGNAWRYAPKTASSPINGVAQRSRDGVPMTHLIREYFKSRPNEIVHLDDLIAYVGAPIEKVRSGINNARQNSALSAQLDTVQAGKSWRYRPPRQVSQPQPTPTTQPVVQPQLYAAPTPAPVLASGPALTIVPLSSTGEPRLFEEVGLIGGGTAIIIRDPDGNMFRATPM